MGDYRTTRGETLPPPKKIQHRRLRMGLVIFLVATSLVITVGLIVHVDRYASAIGFVTTEKYAEVRPSLEGAVSEILVDSGQDVKAGEVLARLNSSREKTALAEARASLRKAQAALARRATAANGGLDDRALAVLKKDIEARQAVVRAAELRISQHEIKAPIAGHVLRYEFVIGERVRPENVMFELFGGSRRILKLKVSNRFAGKVGPGQQCMSVVSVPGESDTRIVKGRVENLRFVNSENGIKSYRVAYCSVDSPGLPLVPGARVQARIYYGRSTLLRWLFGLD